MPHIINTENEDERFLCKSLVVWCETILTCVCSSDVSMCEFLTVVVTYLSVMDFNYYLQMNDIFHQISCSIIIKNDPAYFLSYDTVFLKINS